MTRLEDGVPVLVRGAALVETMAGNASGLTRSSRLGEILYGENLKAPAEARTLHPNPPSSAPDHSTLLNAAERRLVTEWMDLGGQYFNNPSASNSPVRTVRTLSEATFTTDVLPVLKANCVGCHQPTGSSGAAQTGTSFLRNRYVLTGDAEGDFGVTLSMISNTCDAPFQRAAAPAFDRAASGRRHRPDHRGAAGGQRGLHGHRQLDHPRLPHAMKRLHSKVAGFGRTAAACIAAALLSSCGGGGDNPLGNPPVINNPGQTLGQKLSFAYFQKCINPIFVTPLQVNINGTVSTNTCASSGCHDNASGTGGAFRVGRQRGGRRCHQCDPMRCGAATCTRTSCRRKARRSSARPRRAGC